MAEWLQLMGILVFNPGGGGGIFFSTQFISEIIFHCRAESIPVPVSSFIKYEMEAVSAGDSAFTLEIHF
jgi:hypothetical protein